MDDTQLALRYAPMLHLDRAETLPLVTVGYTVFREERPSDSFPRRMVKPEEYGLVIEYALYWDFDIEHLYDLEHIWVWVSASGQVTHAEGSFQGRVLNLWAPDLPMAHPPEENHVHAYCQPGKHAFLPDGELFRLVTNWQECCMEGAGRLGAKGAPLPGEDDERLHERCRDHIRRSYAFTPTLDFDEGRIVPAEILGPWESLKAWIPSRIGEICASLPKD